MQEQEQKRTLTDKVNNIEYVKGKLLGTGGFAKCFQVISQNDGKIYAAKVIPKKSINEKRQRYKLLIEIKIHRSLKHKHIVQFIQAFQDRENVYILLEYCRNYTLKDLVKRRKRLTEFEAKVYTYQIVKAVQYIHSQSIIHRDLKLGNILINDSMDTKICDFGLSTRVKQQGQIKKTICGTPNYIAPQILQENGHSYEVDIWSIGVIMYTLLFGKPPFQDNTVQQTYQNIKHNRFRYPQSVNTSSAAKDLINRILVTDPSRRISLDQILQHQFMVFREDIPKIIPKSTLAVPPFKFDKIESKRISLQDINLQMSEQYESYFQSSKVQSSDLIKSKSKGKIGLNTKESQAKIPFVYIRQCFFSGDTFGYLLSSGIVGIFYKNTGMNVVLEYGSANYYIISKSQNKPIKKPLPSSDIQLNSLLQNDYLQYLLNFKSYFVNKFGVFKMDQMRKKMTMSMSTVIGQQNLDQLVYVKKILKMSNGQILSRLNNSVIQLHFNDLTSIMLNREDDKGIFLVTNKGKVQQINYKQCTSVKLKTKVRRFSNLMQSLSQKQQQEQQQQQKQYSDGEEIDQY